MFDIGFTEIIVIAVIGLFVIGPEKLPHTIRMTMAFIRKIKIALIDMQIEVEREVDKFERQAEIKELREQVRQQIDDSGVGELKKDLDELNQDLHSRPSASKKPGDDKSMPIQSTPVSTPEKPTPEPITPKQITPKQPTQND